MQIILDKGQREIGYRQISSRVFVLMLTGLIAGILWELREKEPVVRLRMLKDRNFAMRPRRCFFWVRAVRQHGADPAAFAAASGLYGATGREWPCRRAER